MQGGATQRHRVLTAPVPSASAAATATTAKKNGQDQQQEQRGRRSLLTPRPAAASQRVLEPLNVQGSGLPRASQASIPSQRDLKPATTLRASKAVAIAVNDSGNATVNPQRMHQGTPRTSSRRSATAGMANGLKKDTPTTTTTTTTAIGQQRSARPTTAGLRPALSTSNTRPKRLVPPSAATDAGKNPFVAPIAGSRTRSSAPPPTTSRAKASTVTDKASNTATTATKKIEDGDQKVREKVAQMLDKFKMFTIFLDGGIDGAKQTKLAAGVREMGGAIDSFLRKGVTHFVTAQDVDGGSASSSKAPPVAKKSMLQPPTARNATDNLAVAKRLGLKIWNVSRLEKVLVVLSHYGSNTASNSKAAPQKLKDALRDERLYGPSTSRDPDKRHSNFQPFKDLYFLIEELTGQYKPIVVKDISSKKAAPSSSRGPAYPEIQWQNSTGHCVFIPQAKATVNKHQAEDHVCSEKAKGKENQDIEDDDLETIDESSDGREPTANEWRSRLQELAKQPDFKLNPPLSGDERFDLNNLPSDEEELQAFIVYAAQKVEMYDKLRSAVIPNSTASGLVSGSVANLMPKRDMTKDPRLAHLGQRVMTLNEKGQVTKAGTVTATETKKRKVARPVPGKSFYRRPGYCENCAVKYDEFCQHVRSRQHKYWAKKSQNFRDLDYLLVKITRANAPEPDENDIDIHEEDDCDVHDGLDCAMSDYAESMEIEFEAEQETEIVKCLENDKKAQEADEEHLTKADEEEELIVQTQAVEEPELKEYQYEEEEEERDLSQEHMSVNYAELEIELPCADAPADIADGDVEKETQEAVSKDVAVEEVVTTCVQPEEQADQKDQRLGQFVEERSDTKPLGDRGDSMETLVEIEGPIDSAPMNVIETLIADERVEDKEPDVIQDNKTSHLPSVHLRYDFGNTSCGPSAMYKDEESPDMDEEEPQADAASSKKRKQVVAFDIPTVTTRRQIQAENEELLLAIRMSEASALQSQQNDSAQKKRRLSQVAVTPAILKTSRRKTVTPASASPSISMSTRLSASKLRVKTPSKLNTNTSQSSTTKKESTGSKVSRSASVNTVCSSASSKKAPKRVSAAPPLEAMEEEPSVGRRALRERVSAVNYKKML